ncbi:MAG: imelysin family protein [Bacteroidota bacterium]|nr:imelysin family protein [Bacteroidota bacterium]
MVKKSYMLSRCTGALLLGALFFYSSCERQNDNVDTWDRSAMLIHWADDIIMPAWNDFAVISADAAEASDTFALNLDSISLYFLRQKYESAYVSWQKVSLFDIGPGEYNSIRLRCNTYPTDTGAVKNAIANLATGSSPNFQLPSTFIQQGFPALDYLLFNNVSIENQLRYYSENPFVVDYIQLLFHSIAQLGSDVRDEWNGDYRSIFIEADGSSASASVNKMANDFIYHYEKELRAGKVGIPAGIFSSNILVGNLESYYNPDLTRELFQISFDAHVDFFNGIGFNKLSQGPSFATYLDHLDALEDGTPLSDMVNQQFDASQAALDNFTSTFKETTENNVFTMLALYDELQRNTIRIKTDVMQVLNVKIDYVDADGD